MIMCNTKFDITNTSTLKMTPIKSGPESIIDYLNEQKEIFIFGDSFYI